MSIMRVAAHGDHVLTYDTDDAEKIEISAPVDMIDVTPPFANAVHREAGQAHLVLRVDFKEGKRALWVKGASGEGITPERIASLRASHKIWDRDTVNQMGPFDMTYLIPELLDEIERLQSENAGLRAPKAVTTFREGADPA